jgi:hypothetical protein
MTARSPARDREAAPSHEQTRNAGLYSLRDGSREGELASNLRMNSLRVWNVNDAGEAVSPLLAISSRKPEVTAPKQYRFDLANQRIGQTWLQQKAFALGALAI